MQDALFALRGLLSDQTHAHDITYPFQLSKPPADADAADDVENKNAARKRAGADNDEEPNEKKSKTTKPKKDEAANQRERDTAKSNPKKPASEAKSSRDDEKGHTDPPELEEGTCANPNSRSKPLKPTKVRSPTTFQLQNASPM